MVGWRSPSVFGLRRGGDTVTRHTSSFSLVPYHPTRSLRVPASCLPNHRCDSHRSYPHPCLAAHQTAPTAVVESSGVGEVGEDTYYCVHGVRNVIRQVGIDSLQKLPQTVHQTWGWELPRTERIPRVPTKAEGVPVYRPVRARDGDP